MSEPAGLEERLRAALGGRVLEAGGPRPVAHDASRTRLLEGIRRRRVRRVQATGVAAVVALGLSVTLSQVLGGAAPAPPVLASPAHADASAPAQGPAAHRPAAVEPAPSLLPRVVATCHLRGRALDGCGTVVAGTAAPPFSATAAGAMASGSAGPGGSPAHLGAPLVVRAGTRVVIDLPQVPGARRWGTPSVAGTPGHQGSPPPVVVRPVQSPGTAQRFVVATEAPATVVLESEDDVVRREGAAPASAAGPVDVWVLELKVEGT